MLKPIYYFFCCFLLVSCSGNEEHKQIILRQIAHRLLVQSGNAPSRVLPIEKFDDNRYHIKFEKEFSFVTDTLINIVNTELSKSNLNSPYMVNVFQCNTNSIIYGYEVSSETDFIIPCQGVLNPTDCYIIQIDFLPKKNTSWAIAALVFPLFLFTWFWIKRKQTNDSSGLVVGEFIFDPQKSILRKGKDLTKLTYQEVKLLEILLESKNEVVSRENLINEIWEKEGTVVTGRSLDVLVSKLRKKIASDSSLSINNVHSKGYKLELA